MKKAGKLFNVRSSGGDNKDMSKPSVPNAKRPERLKLHHNNHLSVILESLASDESFMDVTLTAQGKSIKGHKSVLSAVSPYFKHVLMENPCQHPIIIMPRDVTFEHLKYIIAYVYKGEMTIAATELVELLKTTEILQVSGLSLWKIDHNLFPNKSFKSTNKQRPLSKHIDDTIKQGSYNIKSSNSSFKKRKRTPSRENSPPAKKSTNGQNSDNEITLIKEEIEIGNDFKEVEYLYMEEIKSGNELEDVDEMSDSSKIDCPADNFNTFSDKLNINEKPEIKECSVKLSNIKSKPFIIFECGICEKRFVGSHALNDHINKNHSRRKSCCCGKYFETPVGLEEHKRFCLMFTNL